MLYDSVLSNAQKIRFHTPGHGELPPDLWKTDVTELPYSDNLATPTGAIKDLEKFLASAYRAEAAFLSTQGATHNIMQAIYATKDDGAFLVVGKAHLSVYNALRLFGTKAYHVDEPYDYSDVPEDVKTVVLTSPDYFGKTLPLDSIGKNLRQKSLTLIVDSAHGAHFAFSSKLPVSASEYGDLVILSVHKTLPVLTGGSVLVCKEKFFDKAKYARNLLHTTSPNYIVMCSIELAVKRFLSEGEKIYDDIYRAIDDFTKSLSAPYRVVPTDDFSRLVVESPYDGAAVAEALYERGFVCETSYENKVVFIVTCANFFFLPTLRRVLEELPPQRAYVERQSPFRPHPHPTELSFGAGWTLVPLEKAVGKRSFSEVGLYPPGVPLLYAGDVVTDRIVEFLKSDPEKTFGLENGRLRVIN
ncbi:MAG: aminotransferase class I/II-fold pyridoxal phosphate-dependent enzyme [Clostridia bacterium]|nr:aminotransferase class I/II-fold pyridoxal phosphate-dependent enzyme [Clostridia bacterium]